MNISLEETYTYDKYIDDCKLLEKEFSNILRCQQYGFSHDGRKLLYFRLGKGKCKVICSAGVHGRESINTPVMMKIIETYSKMYNDRYNLRYSFRKTFDSISIVFLPLVNPDGFEIARCGFEVINDNILKNRCLNNGTPYYLWKYNARCCDINRNFKAKSWIKKNSFDIPFSENETICLKKIFDIYNAEVYIDFHSRGNCIYYYRNDMDDKYNISQKIIANTISDCTGYRISEPQEEIEADDSGGNTVHYYSESIGGYSITIETLDDRVSFPLAPFHARDVFDRVSQVPLNILKIF